MQKIIRWASGEVDGLEQLEQHYTSLGSGRYRYESANRDFARDLTTDPDGLVIEYPGLFHRTFEK